MVPQLLEYGSLGDDKEVLQRCLAELASVTHESRSKRYDDCDYVLELAAC